MLFLWGSKNTYTSEIILNFHIPVTQKTSRNVHEPVKYSLRELDFISFIYFFSLCLFQWLLKNVIWHRFGKICYLGYSDPSRPYYVLFSCILLRSLQVPIELFIKLPLLELWRYCSLCLEAQFFGRFFNCSVYQKWNIIKDGVFLICD